MKTCTHGVTPKTRCNECKAAYHKKYNETYTRPPSKYKRSDQGYPFPDLNQRGRDFVKENYYLKNPIAKFFLENRLKINTEGTEVNFAKHGRTGNSHKIDNTDFLPDSMVELNSGKYLPYFVRNLPKKST